MRNHWTLTLCGVLLASALASAQPPPVEPARPKDPAPALAPKPPDLQKPQPKPDVPAPAGRLTKSDLELTGCLQRAEAPAGARRDTASAGAAAAPPLAGGYVLRQATVARDKATKEGAPPSPSTQGGREYRLVARDDSIKLGDHVGHEVTVKGEITLAAEPAAPTSTDSATSSSRPSGSAGVETPAGAPAMASAVTVSVTSLKMVSATCSTPAS